MTYLLDTDILIDFFKHKEYATALITRLSKTALLAVSVVSIAELRTGWTEEEADYLLPRLYALCSAVPVTQEIAEQAGKWRGGYMKKGVGLGTPDTLIAASAFIHGYTLISNNARDYPMPELKLYKGESEGVI